MTNIYTYPLSIQGGLCFEKKWISGIWMTGAINGMVFSLNGEKVGQQSMGIFSQERSKL